MTRSQRHVRYTMGFDSTGSDRYPGDAYDWDWPETWPSGSGSHVAGPKASFSNAFSTAFATVLEEPE